MTPLLEGEDDLTKQRRGRRTFFLSITTKTGWRSAPCCREDRGLLL